MPARPTFAVRSSPIHGRGLFAASAIPRRMKLGEVGGILVRVAEARRAMRGRETIHLVEFDRQWALDCTHGNEFSHLNHSCRANCYLRLFRLRVEVYSRGRIAVGSELTVDYGETQHRGGMPCACGAPSCRGRV